MKSFDELYKEHLPLIKHVCNKYTNIELDERKSCGMLGLWQCMEKFENRKKKVKFTTSLYNHINWACQNYLREKQRANRPIYKLKYPESNISQYLNTNQKDLIEKRFQYNMTYKEIAASYGWSKFKVRRVILKIITELKTKFA